MLPLNEVCVKTSSASRELWRLLIAWETRRPHSVDTLSVRDRKNNLYSLESV